MNQFKLILLILIFIPKIILGAEIQIVNLQVENTEIPLGIDVTNPIFSWQMKSDDNKHNCYQTAYQLTVADEKGNVVWNTLKVKSGVSINIKYNGKQLIPATPYIWTVVVWDQNQKKHTAQSWFETGLMNDRMVSNQISDRETTAWSGAKWIGGNNEDMVLYSQYLPVFSMHCSIRLNKENKSTHAGLVYGANDPRLTHPFKNLYKLENKKDSSYISVELDISPLLTDKNAMLNIYRMGYHPDDKKGIPYKSFIIPKSVINNENKYNAHDFSIRSCMGSTQIYVNGSGKENQIANLNLNPLGEGGDFVAFPVVGEIGFIVPQGQKALFSGLEIRNFRSPSNVIFSDHNKLFSQSNGVLVTEDGAYSLSGGKSGTIVIADPSQNSMPILRTTFKTDSTKIAQARLYVTARGIYEIYMNGKRIGNDYFNPGLTQYNKTHMYQTYDVTPYINTGDNALGALLGEGWWSGGITYMGDNWNFFGDRQALLAKLVITYTDGSKKTIVSDPVSWSYYNNGPIVYGSFFQGEVYDARKEKEIEGWSTASYDASKWHQTSEIRTEGYVSNEGTANFPDFNDFTDAKLIGQFGPTAKKIKELTAQSVTEVRPGVYVYDMGQNMVGVPKINLENFESGIKIGLRFAEIKYPDLPEYKENVDLLMLENIRAAMSQDIYITKGGNETIQPRFTFHGYRHVEITGINQPLPLNAVKGTVISSIKQLASSYETSNPLVNKFWKNIIWSTYGNFLSIPTDCPQRNERLGWSGDISVFSRTATYLADISEFLRRHMLAMRDVQRADGRFADVAPLGVGFGETMWGSAGITVAWEVYQQYGNIDLLHEHYNSMKNYINYLIKDINPSTGILKEEERNNWFSLGDWLSLEDDKNEKTLFWESYFIYDLDIMAKMASVLDKKEDEERFTGLSKERKAFFNKTYIDSETGKTSFRGKIIDTQTSYVLPFAFNIFNEKNTLSAKKNFIATVTRENKTNNGIVCPSYSLMTGFIGTAWIDKVLSDIGSTDVAYQLLQQTSYPSWLYPVTQGATTIWERLNSYTHTNGFGGNNRMNSFNHYSFGAVGAWMYNYSLGINRDENSPGFKHFFLKPEPDPTKKMTFAKGYYDSMYGKIESGWKIEDNDCIYHFIVPANTTATVYLKAQKPEDITIGGINLLKKKGIELLKVENGKAVFKIGSGEYQFKVKQI